MCWRGRRGVSDSSWPCTNSHESKPNVRCGMQWGQPTPPDEFSRFVSGLWRPKPGHPGSDAEGSRLVLPHSYNDDSVIVRIGPAPMDSMSHSVFRGQFDFSPDFPRVCGATMHHRDHSWTLVVGSHPACASSIAFRCFLCHPIAGPNGARQLRNKQLSRLPQSGVVAWVEQGSLRSSRAGIRSSVQCHPIASLIRFRQCDGSSQVLGSVQIRSLQQPVRSNNIPIRIDTSSACEWLSTRIGLLTRSVLSTINTVPMPRTAISLKHAAE